MHVEDIMKYILNSFHEKKNSHAFLISTNNIERAYNDVISVVKKINCKKSGLDNCECNICRTIDSGNNPDLIIISPDGKEIKKEQMMNVVHMFSTKPLINTYSVYVVNNADRMNDSAANKILKFLEEPEGNILGFFITDNVQGVLPTIRSRCELYSFKYGSDNLLSLLELRDEEFSKIYDLTMDIVLKLNDSPSYVLMSESKKITQKDRKEVELILKLIKRIYTVKYENVISGAYSDLEYAESIINAVYTEDLKIIVKRIKLLDNIINDFYYNVNKELFLNKLFLLWE